MCTYVLFKIWLDYNGQKVDNHIGTGFAVDVQSEDEI